MPAVSVSPRFDLDLVVRSHGWYDLPPFSWDEEKKRLSLVALVGGEPVNVTVTQTVKGIATRSDHGDKKEVARVVRRVLDLDADLDEFHALCAERAGEGFGWIARRGAGRILRAPTLFEDAVKVLATTNCTWALTRLMVRNLIALHDRGGAFPDAAFLAGLPEERLKSEGKLGYRAPYLARFAEAVASGKLQLQRWEERDRPSDEVVKEMRAVPGFGPYAAETLSRLLGRHDRLGLDSWSRKKVSTLRFRGRPVKDARVARFYAGFGRYAGLAFWLDVTREWHAGYDKLWP
jgi:N-glycosylase/DNA lyase